jgi:hypothetical protein
VGTGHYIKHCKSYLQEVVQCRRDHDACAILTHIEASDGEVVLTLIGTYCDRKIIKMDALLKTIINFKKKILKDKK